LKEIIYRLDNWTIIKLLGGLATILSLIIAFFSNLISVRFKEATKFIYDNKLEGIKGEISKNNNILNSITGDYFSSTQKLLDKKIAAYDLLWKSILQTRKSFPEGIYLIHQILLDTEFEKTDAYSSIANNSKIGPVFNSYDRDTEISKLFKNIDELDLFKPYFSDYSYKLFYVYRALIGRITHKFLEDYQISKIYLWKKDIHLDEILKIILSKKELDYIKNQKIGSLPALMDLLEFKFLQEYKKSLNIKETASDTIEYLKDLESILQTKK